MSEIALLTSLTNLIPKQLLYISLFLYFKEEIYLLHFVPPRQIDMIIENSKEKSSNWFNKINSIVINESRNVEVSINVILTEISVYGEITKYVEKVKKSNSNRYKR